MSNTNNLIKFLENDTKLLEERIQFAVKKFVTINSQMEKNQEVILQWFKSLLLDRNTSFFDRRILLVAFEQCIQDVLHVHSNSKLAEVIFEILLNTIPNEADLSHCFVELLNNNYFWKYFVYHIPEFCKIVSCCADRVRNMDTPMKENISTSILKSVRYVYDHALPSSDLKTCFVDSLAISISTIINELKNNMNSDSLQSSFDDVTFKVLFSDVEFRKLFSSKILKPATLQCSELENIVNHVIAKIRNYPTQLNPAVLSSTYSLIFRGFLLSSANIDTKLKLFFALNSFICMSPMVIGEDIPKVVIFNENINTVNILLECLLSFNVPLDSKVSSITLADWLNSLIDVILDEVTNNFTPPIITLLKTTFIFSPILLENCLRKFTKNVALLKKIESDVVAAYSDLCLYILDVHIKLNRMHKLISSVLISVKENLDEFNADNIPSKFDVLPSEIFTRIQSAVTVLPSTVQNVALLNTILYHLENDCISSLERDNSKLVDLKHILLFDIVTYLLSQFIVGTRIMDYTVPDMIKDKFISLMNNLADLLGRFGKVVISKEHVPEFVETFLQICFVWGNMQIVFVTYESAPRQITKQSGLGNVATNLVYLHTYLSDHHWKLIAQRVTNFGNENCTNLLNDLVLQKIHALPYLEDEIMGPYSENIYGDGPAVLCAMYLASQANAKWLFHHISEFVYLLKPVDILNLSKTLVNYCHICDKKELIEVLPGDFSEMRSLVMAMINCTFHNLSRILFRANMKELKRLLRKIDYVETMQIEMDEEDSPVESLNSRIEELGGMLSSEFKSTNEEYEISNIEKDVFILLQLPARYLRKENKCLVALLTLSLIKSVLKLHNNQTKDKILESLSKFLSSVLSDILLPKTLDCGKLLAWFYRYLKNTSYCDLIMRLLCETDQNLSAGVDSVMEIVKANNSADEESSNVFIKSSEDGIDLITSYLVTLQKAKKRKIDENDDEVKEKLKRLCYQKFNEVFSSKSLTSQRGNNQLALFTILLQESLNSGDRNQLEQLSVQLPEFISYVDEFDSSSEVTSEFLAVLIRYRNKLKEYMPSEFLIKVWISKWFLSDEHLLSLLLKAAPTSEYKEMIYILLSHTEGALSLNDDSQIDSLYRAWKSVFSTCVKEAKTGIKNNVVLILASYAQKHVIMCDEVRILQSNDRSEVRKMFIRLFILMFKNSNISLNYQTIDVSFDLISSTVSCVPSNELLLECIELLFVFCLIRKSKLHERIPSFYLLYKSFYTEIVRRSMDTDPENMELLSSAAHKLEKLTDNLLKSKKDFVKTAINAVSDLLNVIAVVQLDVRLEIYLKNIIYCWIGMCDTHGLQYLSTAMSAASQNLFKQFWTDYKKYYKFSGKV